MTHGLEGTGECMVESKFTFLSQLGRPSCLYGTRLNSCYLRVSLAVDGGIHWVAFF